MYVCGVCLSVLLLSQFTLGYIVGVIRQHSRGVNLNTRGECHYPMPHDLTDEWTYLTWPS